MPIAIDRKELIKKCPSLFKVINERSEQLFLHDRTVEKDVVINTEEQLLKAAMLLIFNQVDEKDRDLIKQPPIGWDQEIWDHILAKPLKEQLIIAATFLMAEYDRVTYIENQNK